MKLHLIFGVFGIALSLCVSAQTTLIKKLNRYSSTVSAEYDKIDAVRKEQLSGMAEVIIAALHKEGKSSVVFTDVNNSAASQLAQALFQVAVAKNRLPRVNVYSAGITESAIDNQCISLLKSAGFTIEANTVFKDNPRYLVNYSWSENRVLLFSKTLNNFQLPKSNLIIINTGNEPVSKTDTVISEIALSYNPINEETFNQIAREMFYVAEKIQNNQLLSHHQ